jgi:hypothetical protein
MKRILIPAFAVIAAATCGDPAEPVAAPAVHLVPPPDSTAYAGEPIALSARATEGGRALPGGNIRWLVDEEVIATGDSVEVRLPEPGVRIVVVEAVGSTGLTARDAAAFAVLPNSQPVAHAVDICCTNHAWPGDTLLLTAYATDVERGVLKGAAVAWRSSLDGLLGTGDTLWLLAGTLSPGDHVITVRAVDPAGNADSLTVELSVSAPPARLLRSRVLADGYGGEGGDVLASDDGGNFYVGLNGYRTLWALDATLATRWAYEMPSTLFDHSTGVTVGPDGTVFVFDFQGSGAALSSDGTLRWAAPVLGHDPHGRFALAPNGALFAAGTDRVVRIDPASGSLLWTHQLGGFGGGPTVAPDGRVVTQLGSAVQVVEPDGTILFNQEVNGPEGIVRGWYMSSMAADGTSYLQRTSLSAVALDGTLKWQIPIGQPRGEPVVAADGRLFTFTVEAGGPAALALSDSGTVIWRQPLSGGSWIPRLTILADGTMLAVNGPNLYRLDSATGAVLHTTTFPVNIVSAVVVDGAGTIFLITSDHRLVAVQGWAPLDPNAPWPTWRRDNRRTAALVP